MNFYPSQATDYVPYYGFGNSNQVLRTSIPVQNAAPGYNGSDQKPEIYLENFSSEIGQLQTDVADLDARLTIVEGDITTIQGDITDLDTRVDALELVAHSPVTLTTIGATPNANAASLVGQQLQLQPADASFPGIISISGQVFSGEKVFLDGVEVRTDQLQVTNGANIVCDGYTETEKLAIRYPTTLAGNGMIYHGDPTDLADRFIHRYKGHYFGYRAGNFGSTAANNTNHGFGESTLQAVTTGLENTALGYRGLYSLTTGQSCTAVGSGAGLNIDTTAHHTFLGFKAGEIISTAQRCTMIGSQAGQSLPGQYDDLIFIGYNLNGVLPSAALQAGDIVVGKSGVNNRVFLAGVDASVVNNVPRFAIVDATSKQIGSGDALPIGSSPNANAMTVLNTGIQLQPASQTYGGVVTTASQTFAGTKSFTSGAIFQNVGIQLPTQGGVPSILDYYEKDLLFTAGLQMPSGAITGFLMRGAAVAASTWEIIITRIDDIVSIQCKSFKISAGTNGTEIKTINALAARFRPAYQINVSIGSFQNGAGNPEEIPICYVDTSGIIHFYRYNGGNWATTNAGSSQADFVIQYHV
jgi:hypothetical protein